MVKAGDVLGRYKLLIGAARGGMGQVWAARLRGARGFQKLVAIKTLLSMENNAERMLLSEARLAALVQHPNVVQTHELGEHEGTLYLVMEWIDGEPLTFLLKEAAPQGGLPLAVAVNLVGQALRGLHAAHELRDEADQLLGVVHRDVSPHNVLVTYSGVAKLLDFGIAKATRDQAGGTANGEIKGKFSYMSPEQITGGKVDRRSDLFAAGILLYVLTTGRHPFKHAESPGVLHSITSGEPVLAATRPDGTPYPDKLASVVMKALERDPDQRWLSAEAMRMALQDALPEAFGASAEPVLKDCLARLLGKRAQARRDALRRLVVAADANELDELGGSAGQASSQSGGSLKAILVDTPSADSVLQTGSQRRVVHSDAPTQIRKASRRHLWVASAGVLLAAGSFALRATSFWPGAASEPAAAGAVRGVELGEPPATRAVSPSSVSPASASGPTAAPLPEDGQQAPPSGSVSGSVGSAAVSASAAPRTAPAAAPTPAAARATAAKQPRPAKVAAPAQAAPTGDLLSPY